MVDGAGICAYTGCMMYVLAFGTALAIAVVVSGMIAALARYGIVCARIEHGRRHKCHVSRLGGVAMTVAFVAALIMHPALVLTHDWRMLIVALIAVVAVGLWDDYRPMTWRTQLFAQVCIAVFLFIVGLRITAVSHPAGGMVTLADAASIFTWASFLVTIAWIVGVMNVMNWLDGIDGLGGAVALIAAGAIFATALFPHVYQPPVAIAAAAFGGAVCGFLVWNWAPAQIIAGTSGAFFWGLLIATLAIFAGAKIATTLLVVVVPLVDALWVIVARLRAGESPFRADRRHLHYRLIDRGWRSWHVATLYATLIGAIAASAVGSTVAVKVAVITGVACIMIGILLWLTYDEGRQAS